MDTVQGTEVQKSTTSGFFVRCGMLYMSAGDLPTLRVNADARVILNGFTTSGVPVEGDKLSSTYSDWICVDRRIRPHSALQLQILCIYRWLGAISVRDHTSLQETTSVLNPKTKKPVYNTWTDPNPAAGTTARKITKICHFRDFLPIRNLTFTKTVPVLAQPAVLTARKKTNSAPWQGLPKGYWLVTDLDGATLDNGVTFTYTVTFTTNTDYDWASIEILRDDRGQEIYVDPVKYAALLAKAYDFGQEDNTTCPGVLRCDRYDVADYPTIFGISP